MNLFGNNPQELAMASLVHDTNRAIDGLHLNVKKITEWLRVNGKQIEEAGINTSELFVRIEYLKSKEREMKAAIDAYYEKFKTDFAASIPPNKGKEADPDAWVKTLKGRQAYLNISFLLGDHFGIPPEKVARPFIMKIIGIVLEWQNKEE